MACGVPGCLYSYGPYSYGLWGAWLRSRVGCCHQVRAPDPPDLSARLRAFLAERGPSDSTFEDVHVVGTATSVLRNVVASTDQLRRDMGAGILLWPAGALGLPWPAGALGLPWPAGSWRCRGLASPTSRAPMAVEWPWLWRCRRMHLALALPSLGLSSGWCCRCWPRGLDNATAEATCRIGALTSADAEVVSLEEEIVMAYMVMAYIVMVYVVMALCSYGLYGYGLYSYGPDHEVVSLEEI